MSSQVSLHSEDVHGDALQLGLYNLVPPGDLEAARRAFPCGCHLVIKEPFFKVFQDGLCGIRVDNPSDVVVHSQELTTASLDQQLEHCRELLEQEQYMDALELSRDALDLRLQHMHLECLGALEHWEAALETARGLKNLNTTSETGTQEELELSRSAHLMEILALCGLRRYKEARSCVLLLDPPDEDLLASVKRWERESTGDYDWSALLQQEEPPEIAEFVGQVVVKSSGANGRGLFVTRDTPPGTLLLVSRALVACRDEQSAFFDFSVKTKTYDDSPLRYEAIRTARNPYLLRQLYALCDGSDQPLPRQSGCALLAGDAAETPLDPERIKRIIELNSFRTSNVWDGAGVSGASGSGIWGLPCMINHSNTPNSTRWYYGAMMIVRAAKHIPKGGEVTMLYSDLANIADYNSLQRWGVVAPPSHAANEAEAFRQQIENAPTVEAIKSLVGSKESRQHLKDPIGIRAFHTAAQCLGQLANSPVGTVRITMEVLRAEAEQPALHVGFPLHAVGLMGVLGQMFHDMHRIGATKVAKEAEDLASEAQDLFDGYCNICYGEGTADVIRALVERRFREEDAACLERMQGEELDDSQILAMSQELDEEQLELLHGPGIESGQDT